MLILCTRGRYICTGGFGPSSRAYWLRVNWQEVPPGTTPTKAAYCQSAFQALDQGKVLGAI